MRPDDAAAHRTTASGPVSLIATNTQHSRGVLAVAFPLARNDRLPHLILAKSCLAHLTILFVSIQKQPPCTQPTRSVLNQLQLHMGQKSQSNSKHMASIYRRSVHRQCGYFAIIAEKGQQDNLEVLVCVCV